MSNHSSNFPTLSQYKPKPKPQQVPGITLQLDNGEMLSATPNIWLAAIIATLSPQDKANVIEKVNNMTGRQTSKIIPVQVIGGFKQ